MKRDAVLVRARSLSPWVRELTFDPGPEHPHVPGHWVTMFLDRPGEEPLKRQYSVASAPRDDGTFDLAVTRVEGGPMSTFLHEAEVGARVPMLPAQGLFVLEPMVRPVVMVATGTGVAPFRAMLEEIAAKSVVAQPIYLLFGSRVEEDLLYRDEFEALAQRLSFFTFIPTLSRAADTWPGRRGWVQAHLGDVIAKTTADVDVYVCGLTKMVKEVRTLCREQLGIERKRVHIERYD